MKKKIKGEVTVEAAIVVPILLLVVISFLYFAFCVHDLIVIKSYVYSAGVENINSGIEKFDSEVKAKVSKAPVLVISPIVKCYKKNDQYIIEINGRNTSSLISLNNIIEGESIKIKIKQGIKRNNMYMVRSLLDFAEK